MRRVLIILKPLDYIFLQNNFWRPTHLEYAHLYKVYSLSRLEEVQRYRKQVCNQGIPLQIKTLLSKPSNFLKRYFATFTTIRKSTNCTMSSNKVICKTKHSKHKQWIIITNTPCFPFQMRPAINFKELTRHPLKTVDQC